MRKIILLLLLLGLVSGPVFSKSPSTLDKRYYFAELETVDHFNNWSIDGWNVIDRRSLIVYASPSRAYLLILDRHLWDLRFSEAISISSTTSRISQRFDTVRVLNRRTVGAPARIVKMYRLEGKAQRRLVRDQIQGS